MGKVKKELLNKLPSLVLYKFLSIVGFVEIILIPFYLTYIYLAENPDLRPYGTILMLVCISLVVFPINLLLTLTLFLESRYRKNIAVTSRLILTHIGFWVYSFIFVLGFFTFVFSLYLTLN